MTVRQTADDVAREAAHWVWRRDGGGGDPAIEAELQVWLSGDRRRPGAFLQAEAAWCVMDGLAGGVEAVPVPRRTFDRRYAIGASLAAIAASVLVMIESRSPDAISTATGEIRTVTLQDRSGVIVNTAGRLEPAFRAKERAVRLAQGEAWFHVRRDPTRPFVVSAGAVRVEAVGTAFSVRLLENGADVYVSEGGVRVWIDGVRDNGRLVAAGSAVRAGTGGIEPLLTNDPRAVDRALAWRERRLDLEGETLGWAVDQINRYNRRQITIGDPVLAQQRMYGAFGVSDPELFARTAATVMGGAIVIRDDKILISSADASHPPSP